MAYIGLGMNNVEAWDGVSGALPPATDVVFRIDSVKQERSSQKGTLQLVVEATVVSQGELFSRKGYLRPIIDVNAKDGSKRRLKQLLDACMIQVDQQGGFDDQHLVGRHFVGDVVSQPYKKTDPATGQTIEKEGSQIVNERPYGQAGGVQQAQQAQPQFQPQAQPAFVPQIVPAQPPAQQGYAPQPGFVPQQPQQPQYQQPQYAAPQPGMVQPATGPVTFPPPGGNRGVPPVTPVQ